MKFHVQSLAKRAARLGTIKDIEGKPNVHIETPVVLLHTQGGHIPHITHEVLKLVTKDPHILQIPLVSMHNFQETMEYYDGTISEFVGSKEHLSCLTLQDPSSLTKQGHHAKGRVPIWTKNGKVFYEATSYMTTVESFKPDIYYILSDGDTNKTSAQKRLDKSVENTISFHKECIERHKKSEILKNSMVLAAITGGYCLKSRQKCMDVVLKDDCVDGYLIDGLHNNGPEVEFLPFDEIETVVEYVIDKIPLEKLRSVQGCWNPVNVIKFVQLGVDFFDTSYCRILTERSAALKFRIEQLDNSNCFEINLRNNKYSDDFQPILDGCQCLTCLNYSRGYIHHLLTVQELLGPVLIMIHNIHHYLRFFKKIRQCIRDGTLAELESRIADQFKIHQANISTRKQDIDVEDVNTNPEDNAEIF